MDDNRNILDRAHAAATEAQRKIGQQAPDEVSFVMGFIACYGILKGNIDIGLDKDAPLNQIFEAVDKDIHLFGRRVYEDQQKQN